MGKHGLGHVSVAGYRLIGSGIPGRAVREHRLRVEKVLGKPLPKGVEIHHFDGNGLNNAPTNLVVCPGAEYHKLLHRRQAALEACGNPNWLRCEVCRQHDDPANLFVRPQPKSASYHKECYNLRQQNKRQAKCQY